MQLKVRDRLKVLFISESATDFFRWLGQLQLAGFDLQAQQVETERALRDACKMQSWDLVLCDFLLQTHDCFTALRIVRQTNPDIPFIFISDPVGEETAVAALKAGANDFVMRNHLSRLPVVAQRELSARAAEIQQREDAERLSKLSLVVQQSADAVLIMNAKGIIEYMNPACERMTGYSLDELKGQTPDILKSSAHPIDFYRNVFAKLCAGEDFSGVIISRHKNGQLFYQQTRISSLHNAEGNVTHFVVNGRDVSQELRAKKYRDQLISVVEATTDIVFMFGPDLKISYANRAARNLFALPKNGALPDLFLADLHAESSRLKLTHALQSARTNSVWQGEMELLQANGRTVFASEVLLAHSDREGVFSFYSLIARDVTERKQFEAELSYQSTHDGLTGLANRVLLADRVEVAMSQALRSKTMVALILLDLDNFKRINEGMGHAVGDRVLQEIAARLKNFVRPSDTVARVGGDEFVMVLGGLTSTQVVTHLLRKIQIEFDSAINVCGQDFYLSFSVGVSFSPNDGHSFEALLRNADAAMHGAKRQGSGQAQWYRSEFNKRGQELLSLESDLRKALQNREFKLAYQPQIDVTTGKALSMEALIRWQHPTRGMMEPSEFVYLLEETGLIVQVGEWVLFQACYDFVVSLGNPYFKPRRVSVNVSPRQFVDPAFVDIINHVIDESGINPDMLELEITESTVMRDVQRANEILNALSGLGVRLAVDDFGTGYSSLAYLKRFPLNVLKIDRAFIRDLPADQNDMAITEASIYLGHKLGLTVVAEGVENETQLKFLRQSGCDLVQGYFTGKPEPIERIIRNAMLFPVSD